MRNRTTYVCEVISRYPLREYMETKTGWRGGRTRRPPSLVQHVTGATRWQSFLLGDDIFCIIYKRLTL